MTSTSGHAGAHDVGYYITADWCNAWRDRALAKRADRTAGAASSPNNIAAERA